MKIKTKEKTVKTFTIKLTESELKGLQSDVFDALNEASGSLPELSELYDALRALVHD